MARKRGQAGRDGAAAPVLVGAALPTDRCVGAALTRLFPSGRRFSKLVGPPGTTSAWVSITTEVGRVSGNWPGGNAKIGHFCLNNWM